MDLFRTLVNAKVGKIPMQRYSMVMKRRKNEESHQFTSPLPPTLPCKVEKLDLFDFVNSHFSWSTSPFLQTGPQDFHRNVLRRHFEELRLSKLDCYGKTPRNAHKWWPTGGGWILEGVSKLLKKKQNVCEMTKNLPQETSSPILDVFPSPPFNNVNKPSVMDFPLSCAEQWIIFENEFEISYIVFVEDEL